MDHGDLQIFLCSIVSCHALDSQEEEKDNELPRLKQRDRADRSTRGYTTANCDDPDSEDCDEEYSADPSFSPAAPWARS